MDITIKGAAGSGKTTQVKNLIDGMKYPRVIYVSPNEITDVKGARKVLTSLWAFSPTVIVFDELPDGITVNRATKLVSDYRDEAQKVGGVITGIYVTQNY